MSRQWTPRDNWLPAKMGMAGVVRQEEAASGGDATPGAAAEERFGVEADEDLPDDDDLV